MTDIASLIAQAVQDIPLEPGDVLAEFSYDGQDQITIETFPPLAYGVWDGVMLLRAKVFRVSDDRKTVRESRWEGIGGKWERTSCIEHGAVDHILAARLARGGPTDV